MNLNAISHVTPTGKKVIFWFWISMWGIIVIYYLFKTQIFFKTASSDVTHLIDQRSL